MERIRYIISRIIIVGCLLIAGCQKEAINSDMEGHWRLTEFVTSDGQTHPCERLYYSLSLWVVEVAEKPAQEGCGKFIGRLEYPEEGKVRMRDFVQRAATSDNGIPATADELKPYGLNGTDNLLEIVKADGKELILQSEYATLYLERF
ncbi:MAG: lipocalin-like domain-containing protein [Bacteroides sp.]|nr:lipocalin-like domain-containing protein [Bacteroides sp.]